MCELLNQAFGEVFTKEDLSDIPEAKWEYSDCAQHSMRKKILGALSTTVLLIQMDMILLVSLSTNHGIQSLLFHVITCEFVKFKTIISQIYLQSRTRLLTRTER